MTSLIKIELEQLLSGVAQLETAELGKFVEQVNLLLAQRRFASLPQPEAELLLQINRELPNGTQHRYDELTAKLQAKSITSAEHQVLLALVDTVEQADAARLQHLIELSQLCQIPLSDLMNQLGIHPPAVHV